MPGWSGPCQSDGVQAIQQTVGELLEPNVRFNVPRYQRKYVWTKKNWSALWNDVVIAINRYAATGEMPTHYLGALVLQSQTVIGPGRMMERQVIDGQQRLATLQILFAAVRDVAATRPTGERHVKALRKLTHNDDEMISYLDDRFKLWPTRHDWAAYRDALDAGPSTAAGHPIAQANAYFNKAVRVWLNGRGAQRDARLDHLFAVVNHCLRFIVIDLEPGDNPQVIFETLNARGVPLQTSDLVRNHIFQLAEVEGLKPDHLYDEHWSRFEDGFWSQLSGKPPRNGTMLDTYLAYFLTMQRRQALEGYQDLYPMFRAYLASNRQHLRDLLRRFGSYGDLFRSLEQRVDLHPYETQFLSRLDVLGTEAIMPLVLHAFGQYQGETRRALLAVIESYLIRRAVVRAGAGSYGSVAAAVLRRIAETPADPVGAARAQLASYTGQDTAWPGDSDVIAYARDRSMKETTAARIRLILSVVDEAMRTPKHERLVYQFDDLTLEHLMPRSWVEHWPLTGEASAADRNRMVWALGNLTLISGELNPELGNEPWSVKQPELAKFSHLLLNENLPRTWDEDAIRARGEEFGRLLVRALTGPGSDTNRFTTTDPTDTDDESSQVLDDQGEEETLADELDMEPDAEPEQDAEPGPTVRSGPTARPEPAAQPQQPAKPAKAGRPSRPVVSAELMARHIHEVLGRHSVGTRLTPGQISRTSSSVYPNSRPSQKEFTDLIEGGTMSGIDITVNKSGHRAVRLSRASAARQSSQPG